MKRFLTIIAVLVTVAVNADAQSALQKLKQKAEEAANSAVNSAMGKVGEKMSNSAAKDGDSSKGGGVKAGIGSILQEAAKNNEASAAAQQPASEAVEVSIVPFRYSGGLDSLAAVKKGSIKKAGAIFASMPKGAPSYPATTDEQMAAYVKALNQAELDLFATTQDLLKRTGQMTVNMDKMQKELDAQYEEQQKIAQRQQAAMSGANDPMADAMKMLSFVLTDAEIDQMMSGKGGPSEADIEKRIAGILNMSVEEYRGMEKKAQGMTEAQQKAYYDQIRAKATPKGKEFLDYTLALSKKMPAAGGAGLSDYMELKMKIMELSTSKLSDMLNPQSMSLSSILANAGASEADAIYQDDAGYNYTRLQWELRNQVMPKVIAYNKALSEWNFPDITRQREETWIGVDAENYIYKEADRPDLSKKKAVEESYRAIAPAVTAVFNQYGSAAAKKITDADEAFKKANGENNSELVELLNKALKHPDCTESDRVGWQTQLYMIEIVPLTALQKSVDARKEYVDAMLYYPDYCDRIELTGIKYNDFKLVYSKTEDCLAEGNYLEETVITVPGGKGFDRGVDRQSALIGKTFMEMLDAVKPCQISYKSGSGNFNVIFGDGYQLVGNTVFDARTNTRYAKHDDNRYNKTVYGKSGVNNEFNKMRIEAMINYFGYFSAVYHKDLLAGQIRYVAKQVDTTATVAGRSCKVYFFDMEEFNISKENVGHSGDYMYVDSQTGAVLKKEEKSGDNRYVDFEATSVTVGAPALDLALVRKQFGIKSADNALWAHGCGVERNYDLAWDAAAWKTMMGVQGWNDVIPAYSGTGFLAAAILGYNDDSASFEVHGTDEADAKAYAAKLEAAGFKGGEWSKTKNGMKWSASTDGGDTHNMSATIEMSKDGKSFRVSFSFDGPRKSWINYV